MNISTRGIVLQNVKFSESSLIVRIFTEQLGLVSYIVKGVRSARSVSRASLLRPLSLLEMEVSHRENKALQQIKEFRRAHNYLSLPFDTLKSSIALLMLEVVSKSLREHDPQPELFEFVFDCFRHLDESPEANNDFHLQFLVHLAAFLGFGPQGQFSAQTPYFDLQEGFFCEKQGRLTLRQNESEAIGRMVEGSMLSPLPVKFSRLQRREMLHILLRYYSFHLEGFSGLKSPDVLEMVFD